MMKLEGPIIIMRMNSDKYTCSKGNKTDNEVIAHYYQQRKITINIIQLICLYDRSLYFSSFVSFFLDLTLATVSKTA